MTGGRKKTGRRPNKGIRSRQVGGAGTMTEQYSFISTSLLNKAKKEKREGSLESCCLQGALFKVGVKLKVCSQHTHQQNSSLGSTRVSSTTLFMHSSTILPQYGQTYVDSAVKCTQYTPTLNSPYFGSQQGSVLRNSQLRPPCTYMHACTHVIRPVKL